MRLKRPLILTLALTFFFFVALNISGYKKLSKQKRIFDQLQSFSAKLSKKFQMEEMNSALLYSPHNEACFLHDQLESLALQSEDKIEFVETQLENSPTLITTLERLTHPALLDYEEIEQVINLVENREIYAQAPHLVVKNFTAKKGTDNQENAFLVDLELLKHEFSK